MKSPYKTEVPATLAIAGTFIVYVGFIITQSSEQFNDILCFYLKIAQHIYID